MVAAGVYDINNCVVLGKHFRGFTVAERMMGCLAVPPGTRAEHQWCPALVVCIHWLWGLATGACIVAGAGCKHTCYGERGAQWQVLGHSSSCGGPGRQCVLLWLQGLSLGMCMALKACGGSWARVLQMHSWRS